MWSVKTGGLSQEGENRKKKNMVHFSEYLWCFRLDWQYCISTQQIEGGGGGGGGGKKCLWAHKIKSSLLNKLHIFQCMAKIFCVKFQRVYYPTTHTLRDAFLIQYWTFKNSQIYKLSRNTPRFWTHKKHYSCPWGWGVGRLFWISYSLLTISMA